MEKSIFRNKIQYIKSSCFGNLSSNIALIKYWGNMPTKFLQIRVFIYFKSLQHPNFNEFLANEPFSVQTFFGRK